MTISARNWAWAVRTRTDETGRRVPLKGGEKVTLLYLAEMENAEEGCAYPTIATIAENTGQSTRTVNVHIATLVEAGAIRIEKKHRSRDGRWLRNTYVLHVPETYRENDPAWMRSN